jgi:hypothetical protein
MRNKSKKLADFNTPIEDRQERKEIEDFKEKFNPSNILNILQSTGKSRNTYDFPYLQYYLDDTGEHPRVRNYSDIPLSYTKFANKFKEINAETIFMHENVNNKNFISYPDTAFYKIQKGYYVETSIGYWNVQDFDKSNLDENDYCSHKENQILVCNVSLLCPSINSELYSKELEDKITEIAKSCHLKRNNSTPCIGMICREDGFYVRDFYITKDYTINNADLHYGQGFEEFHSKLLKKFSIDSKGLVLFHGDPGTGKTFYIRSLIKDLISLGKFVIYFPPSMIQEMVSPDIMTFLASLVMEKAEEGKSCVLLLEDAEPLLMTREKDGRTAGITNLLNVTDGLLNDMLSIQVIATFNTELKYIDKALLRPERLIARKEFKKLSPEDSLKLYSSLGISTNVESEMTLAEIYSNSRNNDILIHEYENTTKIKIGF